MTSYLHFLIIDNKENLCQEWSEGKVIKGIKQIIPSVEAGNVSS